MMFKQALKSINDAHSIVIIQADNPDGDSLGSALALEGLLENIDKSVTLYCAVEIPKYLRYMPGWDRVTNDFNFIADLAIIVDTAAELLLEKPLDNPNIKNFLENHSVVVLDHHGEADDNDQDTLTFTHDYNLDPEAAATGEVIYKLAKAGDWQIDPLSANMLYASIASDTLGLTTESAGADTYQVVADLVKIGAKPYEVENSRRELMKKSAEILSYKAELINRIEYYLDSKLAIVHIPWDDIQKYSDQYNPSVLVLDEMRLVENVKVACAIKTYPDGKITGKLRANLPVASDIAGYFGGGGHSYAAGFKVHGDYDEILNDLLTATNKILKS